MGIKTTEEVRGKGVRRILYGHILTLDSGTKLYVAKRKRREIYRGGKLSISGAMSADVASWAIDESMLMGFRAKGIEFIGVHEEDTGDFYLTRLATFFDRKKYAVKDYTGVGRGGSRQRYVAMGHFAKTAGVAKLDAALY